MAIRLSTEGAPRLYRPVGAHAIEKLLSPTSRTGLLIAGPSDLKPWVIGN